VQLRIADVCFDLSESDEATRSLALAEWPAFLVEGVEPEIFVRARCDPDFVEGAERAALASGEGEWTLELPGLAARLDVRAGRADVRYGMRVGFLNFLRISLTILLRRYDGALFHAASVRASDGGVLLFPGVSGTGKTTIATLAAPRPILSDEISALRRRGDRIYAFPTPFWGDLARGRWVPEGPLARIILLRRADAPSLEPATHAEAVAALLEGANLFETDLESSKKRTLIAQVAALASVPCCRLSFRLPSNPWTLLDPTPSVPGAT
jgi:hypothetical protein